MWTSLFSLLFCHIPPCSCTSVSSFAISFREGVVLESSSSLNVILGEMSWSWPSKQSFLSVLVTIWWLCCNEMWPLGYNVIYDFNNKLWQSENKVPVKSQALLFIIIIPVGVTEVEWIYLIKYHSQICSTGGLFSVVFFIINFIYSTTNVSVVLFVFPFVLNIHVVCKLLVKGVWNENSVFFSEPD